ncbi:MAG: peptidoglycan DD-metalloendopeptidase family protein [Bacillota bacterium]|jgi:murein DD-endopeptidase MepM/ murein hydrolase activator NlpD
MKEPMKELLNKKFFRRSGVILVALVIVLIIWNITLPKSDNTEAPPQNPPLISESEAPESIEKSTNSSSLNQQSITADATEKAEPAANKVTTWLPPANAEWSRTYGYQFDPTFEDYRFHKGADMSLGIDELVFAVADGKIDKIYTDALWGDCIEIIHAQEVTSIYCGVKAFSIKEGQSVIAGETIGKVTDSPPAEKLQESHIHLEINTPNGPQNPLDYIN